MQYICARKDIKPTYCDMADDGGTHKVAVLVTLDLDVTAVQEHLSSLVHTALDQTADSLLGLRRDQRPNVCTRLVS